jgi:hypothetical protein
VLNDRHTAADLPELPWQLSLGLVLVDEKPTLFALYHRGEHGASGHVAAWVVALPDDAAVILPIDGTGSPARPVMTTLQNVRRRWCRLLEAELVQVAGRQALHLAA